MRGLPFGCLWVCRLSFANLLVTLFIWDTSLYELWLIGDLVVSVVFKVGYLLVCCWFWVALFLRFWGLVICGGLLFCV